MTCPPSLEKAQWYRYVKIVRHGEAFAVFGPAHIYYGSGDLVFALRCLERVEKADTERNERLNPAPKLDLKSLGL